MPQRSRGGRTTTSIRSCHKPPNSTRFRQTVFGVILLLLGFSLTFPQAAGAATATVSRKTVYSWPIPAGTGEGVMDVDPTNGNSMVYLALGLPDYVPFFSSDSGSSWSKTPSFTITTKSVPLDPWISYDSQGNAYAGTYIGNATHPYDYLYPSLAKSTDHGASFTLLSTSYSPPWTQWTLPDGTSKPSCSLPGPGAIDFPKIAADKSPTSPFHDYVYIVGSAGVNSTGSSLCAGLTSFIRSRDGGATWDVHRVLSGQDKRIIIRPNNLAVAPNGTIYFAVTYTGGGVLLVYSKDAGFTWSTSAIPLGFGTGDHWISVSRANSNDLYVAFERTLPDNSVHIYMISSTTGGATWSSPVRLDDLLSNDTTDHALPTIDAAPNGRIFAAWRDYRNTPSRMESNSNTTDIYAYSSASPAMNIRISGSTGRYCGAYSPCYRVSGNDYFEVVSGNSNDYVAYSLDEDGNSWPEAYSATVTYPYSITTTVKDSAGNAVTSVSIGTTVHDTSTLSGGSSTITGTITYMRYSTADCTGTSTDETVTIGLGNIVPDSSGFVTSIVGAISYRVSYGGDANNAPTTSACEPLTVQKASPTITTSLSATSILPGGSVFDTATMTSGFQAGGTLTYNLFNGSTCSGSATLVSTVTVTNGVVPNSASQTFNTAGSFSWNAVYGGDANNNAATSPCEPLTVSSLPVPAMATVIKDAQGGTVSSVVVGTVVHDAVTMSGGSGTITGTVTYTLFSNGICTGTGTTISTVTIGSGNTIPDSASVTPTPAGSYSFHASYNGDANNAATVSACEPLTVTGNSGGAGGMYYLQINVPSSGVKITVDGTEFVTNASSYVRIQVDYGRHTILVQPRIPVVPGPIPLGLTNTFVGWADGNTDNPRAVMVVQDTVLTAKYSLTVETSFYFFPVGAIILGLGLIAIIVHRRKASRHFSPEKGTGNR